MAARSLNGLARSCTVFAATQCSGYSPLYEELSLSIAADEALLHLLAEAPKGQARPTLLLAAVHYLLLGGTEHPLGRFYPSIAGPKQGALELGGAAGAFRGFCGEHGGELTELIRRGHTQTNEIRRAAALVLALQEVERSFSSPIELIEIGASAGLNLLYEQYGYTIGTKSLGDLDSKVHVAVAAEAQIETQLDIHVPMASSKSGIDLAPIDIFSDNEVRWLRSFVWPELGDDAERLMAAISIARAAPPLVTKGDALELLPGLLVSGSEDTVPVVFHSTLLTYLSRNERLRLFGLLADVGAQRPLAWIALESPGLLAELGGLDLGLPSQANSSFVLAAVIWSEGRRNDIALAQVDSYGRWMRTLTTDQ